MKLMFGTLRGDHQSVRLNGKYIEQPFTQANTIHYLHQDGFAMNYLRFDDLANAFAINNHLDKILELEEIKRNRGKRISELSGGEKKLMEIVALLYAPGKFLLLDEPFSYLSPVLVEKLAPHIEAQSKFKGIVITDHQYRTVLSVCNKYYLLTQGVLTRVNTILELERFGYLNVH
jgi:ABC-type lipopolysaccharide export system ATPase subunit